MGVEELRSRIQAARRGVVHVEVRERGSIGAVGLDDRRSADALTRTLGFRTLGEHWVSLDGAQASQVAFEVLCFDLAYHAGRMAPKRAAELSSEFLACFDADARFFTNFQCLNPPFSVRCEQMGFAVADGTCETGIVVVDARRAGLLWAEDQD